MQKILGKEGDAGIDFPSDSSVPSPPQKISLLFLLKKRLHPNFHQQELPP